MRTADAENDPYLFEKKYFTHLTVSFATFIKDFLVSAGNSP
jgi:hypothetical protein